MPFGAITDSAEMPPAGLEESVNLRRMSRMIRPSPVEREVLENEIARLRGLDLGGLRARWHTVFRRRALPHLPRHLLFRILAYQLQDRPAR